MTTAVPLSTFLAPKVFIYYIQICQFFLQIVSETQFYWPNTQQLNFE